MMTETRTTLTVMCSHCGQGKPMSINAGDYLRWQGGELVQIAMPYLSKQDRELLVSRTCGECWSNLFGEGE